MRRREEINVSRNNVMSGVLLATSLWERGSILLVWVLGSVNLGYTLPAE